VHESLLSIQGCKLQIAAGSSAFAGGVHDCYCLLCGSCCWDEWSEIKEVGETDRQKRGFEERSFVLKQRSHGGSRHRR
jgi:hypothetical protein